MSGCRQVRAWSCVRARMAYQGGVGVVSEAFVQIPHHAVENTESLLQFAAVYVSGI